MDVFAAIILVCLSGMPPEDCDERTALDVQSIEVANEVECTQGWQEVIARSPRARDIGTSAYVKTLCRRLPARGRPAPAAPDPRPGTPGRG
ncbi:MAG TPA: hypothetical protein VED40_11265 [Azospirillaceae bacterium]|nr:hypothetical protein [Azospirillaceae bacterium]